MFDISYYTNIILSKEVQGMIDAYESVFIIVSLLFFLIGIILLIRQKNLIKEAKRRINDFISNPDLRKPRKFIAKWEQVELLFSKNQFREAINKANELTFEILKRFGYDGNNLLDLINKNEIGEKVLPNIDNIREMINLSADTCYSIGEAKAKQVFDLYKDTLIKIKILDD